MLFHKSKDKMPKKGQTILEVLLLIILFVAVGLSMQGYLRRAIQGNWKQNTDSFSEEQYEPGKSTETVSELKFISPKIKVDLNSDESIEETLNLATGAGTLQINGWGTYYDSAEHD